MGIYLAHNIRILKIKLKKKIFASWLSSVKFAFFFNVLLRQVCVAPPWSCQALVLLAPNSWDQELSADVSFLSVLATVLSEYWKRLENFFQNDTIFTISSKKYHFKKIFPLAFFQYSDRTVASTETNDISAESWKKEKKKKLIQFLIFLCYELSVCPLIFNSNKVYFASSLIAKTTQ